MVKLNIIIELLIQLNYGYFLDGISIKYFQCQFNKDIRYYCLITGDSFILRDDNTGKRYDQDDFIKLLKFKLRKMKLIKLQNILNE